MARIETVARIPHFCLVRVDSYLDRPENPWIHYQLRVLLQHRKDMLKRVYCLTWHVDERRLADNSEIVDLTEYAPELATWAATQIRMHNEGC
jgi:hypothetical protein